MTNNQTVPPDSEALYLGSHIVLQLNAAARYELTAVLAEVNSTDCLLLAFALRLPDGRQLTVSVEDADHWGEVPADEPYGDVSTARDHVLAAAVRHHAADAAEMQAREWVASGQAYPSHSELEVVADRLAAQAVAGWRSVSDHADDLSVVEALARHEALEQLTFGQPE